MRDTPATIEIKFVLPKYMGAAKTISTLTEYPTLLSENEREIRGIYGLLHTK
jgi:hypothetical protein